MSLHPFSSFYKHVHLFCLFITLALHDGEYLIALLTLLKTLLVLVLDKSKLMVGLVIFRRCRVLLPCLILHLNVVRVEILCVETVRPFVFFSEFVLFSLILELELKKVGLKTINLFLKGSDLSNVAFL